MTIFTQDELDLLCRTGEQRLTDLARSATAEQVHTDFRRMLAAVAGLADLYRRWAVTALEWLAREHGPTAAAEAVFYHELWPAQAPAPLSAEDAALVRAVFAEDVSGGGADESVGTDETSDAAARERLDAEIRRAAEAAVDGADTATLLALWQRIHGACDRAATMRRDALTAQLTVVNTRYGADGLEECLRHTAEVLFVPRMAADLALPAEVRLANWAQNMSAGLGGGVRITEHDDRWVLTLDPCGSCGRQVRDGRFAAPWSLGVVAPGQPVGFGRADTTVYQAHLAVMHTLVPIERTGAPWPAIDCCGLTGGACELVLYKDSADTDAKYYRQVGKVKPGTSASAPA